MIRLPLTENEDEAKRRINDVRNTFLLFGAMVIVIRLTLVNCSRLLRLLVVAKFKVASTRDMSIETSVSSHLPSPISTSFSDSSLCTQQVREFAFKKKPLSEMLLPF
ncbi:hypothetical protein ACLKA6_007123 [Drosophila palustris]